MLMLRCHARLMPLMLCRADVYARTYAMLLLSARLFADYCRYTLFRYYAAAAAHAIDARCRYACALAAYAQRVDYHAATQRFRLLRAPRHAFTVSLDAAAAHARRR